MIPEHEPQRLGQLLGPPDDDLFSDQAVFDFDAGVADLAAVEHDRMLDLAALDFDVASDRGVRSHVRVDDSRSCADDGGASDDAVDDLDTLAQGHVPNAARLADSRS